MPALSRLPPGGSDKFLPYAIKEYRLWTLYLHADQRYLGRAYLWLNRPGYMQRLTDLTEEELLHLQMLQVRYERALDKLWQPDHLNYAWLGNEMRLHQGHGHMHLVPRYKKQRDFAGVVFTDRRWGKHYAPYKKFPLPLPIAGNIRDALQRELA